MPKPGYLYQAAVVASLLAVGLAVAANVRTRSPEADLAAPGADLYEFAVTESVRTLMSKEEQAELGEAGRPPSPGPDYFWCDNCKTYHLRQEPAAPGQPAVAPGTTPRPQPAAGARPPSPGPDFYWCEDCKTYHRKQATPGAAPAVHAPATPADGSVASQALGGDYYYCENCKTYHRRAAATPHPAADVSRLIGGVSNARNRAIAPAPAGPGTSPGPAAPAP